MCLDAESLRGRIPLLDQQEGRNLGTTRHEAGREREVGELVVEGKGDGVLLFTTLVELKVETNRWYIG